jgi:hypothetical protein
MRVCQIFLPLVLLLCGISSCALAQDTRKVAEPTFPQTCSVDRATLHSTPLDGPVVGRNVEEQDAESNKQTAILQQQLDHCAQGEAVELAFSTDSTYDALLLNPINVPVGVSLIIDGGVIVYASRHPAQYQQDTPGVTCGNFGSSTTYKVDVGCNPLITLTANSGVYGYGILDGQGGRLLLSGRWAHKCSWWDLTNFKNRNAQPNTSCGTSDNAGGNEQASPVLISAGNAQTPDNQPADCDAGANSLNCDLTIYKITVRNPPYHTMKFGGMNVTIWGVKVQSPWNIPNTDGMDIHASNVTVYDATVANGDQEVTLVSSQFPSENITIDRFHGYGRAGITTLGEGLSTSNVLVKNAYITGALPSVDLVGGTVNGRTEEWMKERYHSGIGEALMNAIGIQALAINNTSQSGIQGSQISHITYQSVCISDILDPINLDFIPQSSDAPSVTGVTFKDVHVLAPSTQVQKVTRGDGSVTGQNSYQIEFIAPAIDDEGDFSRNQFTLDNVVLDDFLDGTTSVDAITATGNDITRQTSVYPVGLNDLQAGSDEKTRHVNGTTLVVQSNTYTNPLAGSNPSTAYPCLLPPTFLTGDMFASLGAGQANGQSTNLHKAWIHAGDTITLSAVVQPAMSQTTLFTYGGYGYVPGLLSIGSPPLTNSVRFYEEDRFLGTGRLSANGTLASLVLEHVSAGTHRYTAQYPADSFYKTFEFGEVTVHASPRAW